MKQRSDKSQKLASAGTVQGVAGIGPFWKYRFENVIFGELKKAKSETRKAGFRKGVLGLDAWQLHFPLPSTGNRLTIPRTVVDECALSDLDEPELKYAIAYRSLNDIPWTLVFIPLRGEAKKTMYTGQEMITPAFSICPGDKPRLYPPFEWRDKRRDFIIPPCIFFPELFFWTEQVSFDPNYQGTAYVIQIPKILRVSEIEHGGLPAFAMAYDTIGNILLFRQPLDLFGRI